MKCEFTRQLQAYHDQELPAEEAGRFQEHLQTCAACREELDELQRMSRLIAGMGVPDWTEDHRQRLHQRVGQVRDLGLLRIAKIMTAAAAVILLLGLAGLGLSQSSSATPAAWEQAAVTLRDDSQSSNAESQWASMVDFGLTNSNGTDQ